MTMTEKQWHATKYGELMESNEIKRDGKSLKWLVYQWEGNLYQELWDGIYCVYFGEIM